MPHDLLIVAPYTRGTVYADEARELAESAARLGYRVEPLEMPDRGHWVLNVSIKPRCLYEAFRRHQGPMLVLDADCRILRPLDELVALLDRCELAIKYRPGYCFSGMFNVGVMLLAQTPVTLALVERWAELTEVWGIYHRFPDQATFTEALLAVQHQIRFRPLPLKFHVEPRDVEQVAEAERVIFHHKSSRVQRNSPAQPVPRPNVPPCTEAQFVCLRPKKTAAVGLPLAGADGAAQDLVEFAQRFGIANVWVFGMPVAEHDRTALEHCKPFALNNLRERFKPGSRLVVCDHDVIFTVPPHEFAAPLEVADMVLAWDASNPDALPSTRVIGLRLTDAVCQQILPAIERTYVELRPHHEPADALARAIAQVLSAPPADIKLFALSTNTFAELPQATHLTRVVGMRGEPACTLAQQQQPAASISIPQPATMPAGTRQPLAVPTPKYAAPWQTESYST